MRVAGVEAAVTGSPPEHIADLAPMVLRRLSVRR
jgi:hypothetical protein